MPTDMEQGETTLWGSNFLRGISCTPPRLLLPGMFRLGRVCPQHFEQTQKTPVLQHENQVYLLRRDKCTQLHMVPWKQYFLAVRSKIPEDKMYIAQHHPTLTGH